MNRNVILLIIDNFFKNLFKNLYAGAVEAGISIGTLDKQIDMVLHGDNPKIQHSKIIELVKTPKTHIFEFKSHRDPYSKRDLSKLIGYGAFYAENKEYGPIDIQESIALWFIATIKNSEMTTFLANNAVEKTSYAGIYQLRWNYPFYVVIINELEIREENIIFLLNSSGNTLNQFLDAIIHQQLPLATELHTYLRAKLYMDYREVKNLTEVKEYFDLEIRENIQAAVQDIGLEKVMDAIGTEKVLEAIESFDEEGLIEHIKKKYGIDLRNK